MKTRAWVWGWGVLALVLLAGCPRKSEPVEPKSRAAKASTRMKLSAQDLAPACEEEVPESADLAWLGGVLVVQGGSQGTAQFAGEGQEPAIVVVQNGDAQGGDEVQSATVTLNGVSVGAISSGTPLLVRAVTLAGQSLNQLMVSATGGGRVRVAVASLNMLPCGMADTGVLSEAKNSVSQTFSSHGVGSMPVLMVQSVGAVGSIQVSINGVNVELPVSGNGVRVAPVALVPGENTLNVFARNAQGSSARVSVFDADTLPPPLTMYEPENGAFFTSSPVSVSGTFGPDTKGVWVAGALAGIVGHNGYQSDIGLVEGVNAITAAVVDSCGNVARVCRAVVLDSQAPVIAVSGVTEGLVTQGPVTPTWTVTGGYLATSSATLDGNPWTPGTSVSAHGTHELLVTATDQEGRVAMKRVRFTVLVTGPVITVTGVQDGVFVKGPVTPVIDIETQFLEVDVYTLDEVGYIKGTPITEDGPHTLEVIAKDRAGNFSVTTLHFTLDSIAPSVTVVGPAEGSHLNEPVVVTYTVDDANLVDAAPVATLDGQPFVSGDLVSAEGARTVEVTATDKAGNQTKATRHFTLDFTPPEVALTGVVENSLVKTAVTPTFSASDANLKQVGAALNGAPFVSGTSVTADGAYLLEVKAEDLAGNQRISVAHFTIDATAPEISVFGVADGARYRVPVEVTFTATDAHSPEVSATLDGQPFTSGGQVAATGSHTLVVTARDALGNERAVTLHFAVDTVAPTVVLESPSTDLVTQASEASVVVRANDDGPLGEVRLGGIPMVRGPDGKYRAVVPLTEGGNAFEVVAFDDAGNSTALSFQVVRDTVAPALVVAAPLDHAPVTGNSVMVAGTATDLTELTVKVGGTPVVLGEGGAFSTTYVLQSGQTEIVVSATDAAGNTSTVTRSLSVGTAAPTLVVTDPPEGYRFTEAFITVRGEVTLGDPTDTPQLTVDGVSVPVGAGGRFAHTLEVPVGPKAALVRVVDRLGQSAQATLNLIRLGSSDAGTPPQQDAGVPGPDAGTSGRDGGAAEAPPSLVVESPADGTVVGGMRFAVTGRVDEGALPLQVTVNGLPAAVTSRHFSASLALLEGKQSLSIQVTDALGRVASAQRTVTVDRTAPYLQLTRPTSNPAQVSESPYLLQGTVGDANLASLTVRGISVPVVAGGFSVALPLQAGNNAIEIVAEDLAGNHRELVQHLFIPSVAPVVTILTPLEGTQAEQPIVTVRAQVTSASQVSSVSIGTGAAAMVSPGVYEAQVPLSLGENTIDVMATDAQGLSSSARVTVRYRDATQEPLAVTGVEPASGTEGVETDALVSVAFNKPVDEATAAQHFEVRARGELLEGGYSLAPGGQTMTFVARRSLPVGERVIVKVSGMKAGQGPDQQTTFSSEFTVRRPLTVVRGVVLDERFQPVPGVRVQVMGQDASARTGPDGNWALLGIHPGSVVVRFEGGTTSDGRVLPTVRRSLVVAAEQETKDRPLMLVAVNSASAQAVDGASGGTVSFNGTQGAMKLEIPAGGLSFLDGSVSGFLSATELPPYARPVPIEDRAAVAALWQLGPEQVHFMKSVKLTLPNRTSLAVGRMVVLLAQDEKRLALKRVGFGHVTPEGIVSDGDVASASFEYFGYMEISPEQQLQVEAALAQAGGVPGSTGGGTDGGLGFNELLPSRSPPTLWQRMGEAVLGTAHAQWLAGLAVGLGILDTFPGGSSRVWGVVRTPREDVTALTLMAPAAASLSRTVEVDLPYTQALEFSARYSSAQASGGAPPTVVNATVEGVSPTGGRLAPEAGEEWQVQGEGEVSLFTEVTLAPGTTTFTLTGRTPYDVRAIRLKAELEPILEDGGAGAPRRAKLTLVKESDSSEDGAKDPLQGSARFQGVRVDITSTVDTTAATEASGQYSTLVPLLASNTMSIACADIPLGPRWVARLDANGNTRFDSVGSSFSTCSPDFWLSPGGTTRADILVDVRLLHGRVTFKTKDGTPVPGICKGVTKTSVDPVSGQLRTVSEDDVATTEVHFFREDDLEHPLAKYAVTQPLTEECSDAQHPPQGAQGEYSRVRLGPTHGVSRATKERCQELEASGPKTEADKQFFRAECGETAGSFLWLVPGDRLVVFAVNHATGYAGMSTVTVPPVNTSTRGPDGLCAADANGLLKIQEGDQTVSISHCTQAELGIPGDVDLYPPEIDVRVQRRAQDDGFKQGPAAHLIRTGGAGTTRDDAVQVVTHWRVRRAKQEPPRTGETGGDGGVPGPDAGGATCVRGFQSDGGTCAPGVLTDDDARGGTPLEVYCSELLPTASPVQRATCLKDDQELRDVPKGVPALEGQIVRVTGTAVEQPAVTTFQVAPGQNTVNIQASLRMVNQEGKQKTLNNLVRANYYLHVVGNRLLERDRDGDGYVSPAENEATPPRFEEPNPRGMNPPGLPARALFLKSVFRRLDAEGAVSEQYDFAREHEFRVLALDSPKVSATGSAGTRPLETGTNSAPASSPQDLSYDFLASLLAPDDPGRAGTLSGDYRVRLGSDQFGIDCPLTLDTAAHTITASCGGDSLADVLSASDILYVELYLSGNAENVLYRFNFQGLAARKDDLTVSTSFTADASVTKSSPDGTPAVGRPISRPAMADFMLDPAKITAGMVKLCLNEGCGPEEGSILKEALVQRQPDGKYSVFDTGRGSIKAELQQSRTMTAAGARRIRLPLPAYLARGRMPGSKEASVAIYLVLEPIGPNKERIVSGLGRPLGSFTSSNAVPVGQPTLNGVNLASGLLSLTHEDFSVPFLAGSMGFTRTYNNQSNEVRPLGVGWTHNYEGWVREEEVGRYLVVINGQGFAFPECTKDLRPGHLGSVTSCKTDNSHGHELTVDAPLEMPDGEERADKVVFTTSTGERFEFNRPAQGPQSEGRRRWLLTRYADAHGRENGLGWTTLAYDNQTDMVRSVQRLGEKGSLALSFEYEPIVASGQHPLPELVQLSKQTVMQWLKSVSLMSGTTVLYKVEFTRDDRGNLTRAVRTPGGPSQIYAYSYVPLSASVSANDRWNASNELETARLIHGATETAEEPVVWRATYSRNVTTPPYVHLTALELVSEVKESGMTDGQLRINYGAETRSVTLPDNVPVSLKLNESGNYNLMSTPAGKATAKWGSDSRGGAVFQTSSTSRSLRTVASTPNDRLQLLEQYLTQVPAGSASVAGLPSDGKLSQNVWNPKFGVPEATHVSTGDGLVTMEAPHSATGDLQSLSVKKGQESQSVMTNAAYDADGTLESYQDAAGRQVQFSEFNALGQPQRAVLTLGAATTGFSTLTRALVYDNYGRLTSVSEGETGNWSINEYDALGRRLTTAQNGTPPAVWNYAYQETTAPDGIPSLTVTETLNRPTLGTSANHRRKMKYVDGVLASESFMVGDPAHEVTRSYAYAQGGRLDTVTDEMGHPHKYVYDDSGNLTHVMVGLLFEASYARDAEGNPLETTDSLGRTTQVGYDGLGRPVSWNWGDNDVETVKLDAQGNSVRRSQGSHEQVMTTFDPLGNAQRVDSVSPSGAVHASRLFDSAGRLTRLEDRESGLVETYVYGDVLGRLTERKRVVKTTTGELTQLETRTYTTAPLKIVVSRVIDENAQTKRTETETQFLDPAGRVLEVHRLIDGQPSVEKFEYTERGQVWSYTSPTNEVTKTYYDPLGNKTQEVDAELHATVYELDDAGRVHVERRLDVGFKCTYDYDDLGRLSSKTIAANKTTPQMKWDYSYSVQEKQVTETANFGSGTPIVTTRKENARGRLVRLEVSGGGTSRTLDVTLDGPWELSREVNEGSGWTAKTEYLGRDDQGRVLNELETWASGTRSYRYQTTTTWLNRTATQTQIDTVDGQTDTRVSTYEVDSLGNVLSLKIGADTDTWEYDAAGNVLKKQPSGAVPTTYSYVDGVLKTEKFGVAAASGLEETKYTYYKDGQLQKREDPDGRETLYEYWPRGLLKTKRYGKLGDYDGTQYTYDANGSVVKVAFAYGTTDETVWEYARGARGELLGVTQPGSSGSFAYEYDGLLRLTKVTPPSGSPTAEQTFAYDSLGRQVLRTRGSARWQTTWAAGVATQVDGNGDAIRTLMDGRGRASTVTYEPGPASAGNTTLTAVSLGYTAADRPRMVLETRGASGTVESEYRYDARGRLRSQRRGSETVTFGYHTNGQRNSVMSLAGAVGYGFDSLDRIKSVTGPAGESALEWEAGGARLLSVKGGNVVERRCYDSRGRMKAILNGTTDVTCSALSTASDRYSLFEYEYDGRGNRLKETYRGAGTGTEVTEYGYDAADRLAGVRNPDGRAVLYRLADDGTRLQEKETAPGYAGALSLPATGFNNQVAERHWRYSFDSRGGLEGIFNELESDEARKRLATYVTDVSGRVTSEKSASAQKEYGWDGAGRLAKVVVTPTGGSSVTTTYTYGWDGLRVQRKTGSASISTYQWGEGELLEERLPGPSALVYTRAIGLVLGVGAERVLHDALGSAAGRVNGGGNLTASRYDAWGGYRSDTAPTSTQASLGYTGHAWDADVGLTYAQQRWYNSTTGRFLSEDPVGAGSYLGIPTGIQTWLYANGNPLRYTDPDGQSPGSTVEDHHRALVANSLTDRGMLVHPSQSREYLEAVDAWAQSGFPLATLLTQSELAVRDTRDGVIGASKWLIFATTMGFSGSVGAAADGLAARWGLGRAATLLLGAGLDASEGFLLGAFGDSLEQSVELTIDGRESFDLSQLLKVSLRGAALNGGLRLALGSSGLLSKPKLGAADSTVVSIAGEAEAETVARRWEDFLPQARAHVEGKKAEFSGVELQMNANFIGLEERVESAAQYARLKASLRKEELESYGFYKENGGRTEADFISEHSYLRHRYNLERAPNQNRTQFDENVDVARLREDTIANPDRRYVDPKSLAVGYTKSYPFDITPNNMVDSIVTPASGQSSRVHKVFVNPNPELSSQFPLAPRHGSE
ncbi:hypothetical protein JGU66_25480 [Myxococcaceae bacterium JPH2]|nr:hypothetical protein [Myxococcaceae bacterium JPH2]